MLERVVGVNRSYRFEALSTIGDARCQVRTHSATAGWDCSCASGITASTTMSDTVAEISTCSFTAGWRLTQAWQSKTGAAVVHAGAEIRAIS